MDQKDVEQKPRRGDGKTFTLQFWMGFVLAGVVFWFVDDNPVPVFLAFGRYSVIILLSLSALAMFVQNKRSLRLGKIYRFLEQVHVFISESVFKKIKSLWLGFVLGFAIWIFAFYIVPRAKIEHMQHIRHTQQVHQNLISGDK